MRLDYIDLVNDWKLKTAGQKTSRKIPSATSSNKILQSGLQAFQGVITQSAETGYQMRFTDV
jgi:hypothetical protein